MATQPTITDGATDIRTKLARNANGGPNRSINPAFKRGLIVHWNGPTAHADDMTTLLADSRYHALVKDWSSEAGAQHGDGLMYHLAIGQDGTRYWCRDIEAVLWHCGAWPENEVALSVLVLCAANRSPTPKQLDSLRIIVDRWRITGHTDRASVKGHQEVSGTDCPGPDLMRWVRAYRQETTPVPTPDRDAAWDAYRAAHPGLGDAVQAGRLVKVYPNLPGGDIYDGDALICQRGVLGWRNGAVLDLTERQVDDWSTQQKQLGLFTPY